MQFYSQVSQDRFVFEWFFRGKRNGVFVDVGAYDGEKFSNTLFFERHMGWTGLCVEPQAAAFAKLTAGRRAVCEQVCVSDFEGDANFVESDAGIDEGMLSGLQKSFDPRHVERLKTVSTKTVTHKVPVVRLSSLLEKHGLTDIDYCSIDVEGGELAILKELDFEKFRIAVLTIENNYDDERIPKLMADKGYDLFAKLEQDYVFKRRDVRPLPQTTVFCAVWHGDPNRMELLRGHVANLQRQTVPIELVYVFDGGDPVPDWLPGRAVSVREPLTIYQAWNVALSMVQTPLVMNLNLDDRLAVDAVAQLQQALKANNAAIAGGDWKICYSQAEVDSVENCFEANNIPFALGSWPPKPGTNTRLGSGTGEVPTLGPATLWSMESHIGAPRYPARFGDGSPIRAAGDAAWWAVMNHQQKKMVRLPLVIGHYHSHPSDQAEFRLSSENEMRLLEDLGCSLI